MAKIRVRDLAAELGIGNKEILHILRDLELPVKSHMSSLEEEQAQTVRDHVKAEGGVTEVVRKEVQPGVVVRRRKRRAKKPAAAEAKQQAEPETEAEPEKAPAPKPAEPEAAAPEQAAPEQAAPEQAEPEQAEPAAAAEPKASEPEARIVSRPGDQPQAEEAPEAEAPAQEAPAAEEEAAPAEEAPAAAEAPPAPEAPEAEETPEEEAPAEAEEAAAPEAEAEQAEEEDEGKGRRKKKGKSKEKFSGPQVKVIHRPEVEEEPAPRTSRRSRPKVAPPEQQLIEGPPSPDKAPRRKKRKDRRVVEYGAPDKTPPRGEPTTQTRPAGPAGQRPPRGKKRRKKGGGPQPEAPQAAPAPTTQPMKAAKRKLRIEDAIRVSEMAQKMGIKAPEIIRVLMGMGVMATINQSLDLDTAGVVAAEFGYEVEKKGFSEEEFIIPAEADKPEDMKPRPPVVTIMGHVDHGKTSLLDAIRKSNITGGEAGGITQHIGAYHVASDRGEIVFLDTPGHEAFTAMRARGAQVTDLVVLVVAADDGVMDQTREAINHSKAAGVPILVAVNKIDKEDADPERVMRELAEQGLQPEAWGGDTIFANVSAKNHIGLDELMELILLQSEVLELNANPEKPARGHIVEARLDKGRGPVGSVLIQEGTLHQNDAFVCGLYHGKVRALFNDQGQKIDSAGPAIPVEVQGFDGVPEAGDEFVAVSDDKVARRIAEQRQLKARERELAKESKVTLESFLKSRPDLDVKTLNLVLKADVQGSLEAISDALVKLSTEEVKIEIIHSGAGAITESDIMLASASEAVIIGFNVRPTVKVKEVAEQENVEIRFYDIIYKLVSDIKDAMTGMLAPVISESYLGQAEVRQTFAASRVGTIAGCYVTDGKITRNARVRLVRDGVVVHTGELSSLKRFKDDAKEVAKGYECGMTIKGYNDIKAGDVIEAFEMVEEKATL